MIEFNYEKKALADAAMIRCSSGSN